MTFGQEYFDNEWGTVHRHDYVDYWANRLSGYKRILDIGTGCGYLVKVLRERGHDAWGAEISEYAIANTCAPGFVLNASVTDLPFKDDSFDVVFSNGLWALISEDDILRARDEIWRVGREQLHNIDHDQCDYRPEMVTWKSQEWWTEQLSAPKVLVSCPTHECKEYAHAEWLKMAKSIDYPNYEVFVVDNSPTPDCANRWGFEWLKCDGDISQRMAACMELVRQKFLSENYRWWFNVEIDVIPDPKMLITLIRYGKDGDWISHVYPPRGGTDESNSGVGCCLFSRRLIEDFSFNQPSIHDGNGVDSFMWEWVRPKRRYKTREFWGHLPIKHLLEP